MKTIFIPGMLMAGLLFTSTLQAGGTTEAWGFSPGTDLYLGLGAGAANQRAFDDGTTGAGKVYGGIRYRFVGAELGYFQTGEAENSAAMARDPVYKSELQGLTAAAVGYMPIMYGRTELIGKLGAAYWDQANSSEVSLTNVKTETSDEGFSALLGVGAQYRLYQNVNLRGEWEHLFNVGEGSYETDVDLLTLGVSMSTL